MPLTPQQQAAVENRGGSLLVSAAAGSGKTRVLVDRLFRYVTEERQNVDDFLIITYTRAAAAELRERIAQELSGRMADLPNDRHLQRQLMLVYQADIKTIDAFCTALLRENIHLMDFGGERGLTADFRVLDDNEATLLRRRVLPRVLEGFYTDMTPDRIQLADAFGFGRDDSRLEELVLELYNKVQSHAYPERWLEEQRAAWAGLPPDGGETVYGRELLSSLTRKAAHWAALLRASLGEMAADGRLEKAYAPGFAQAAAQLEALAAASGWDEARDRVRPFPGLTAARKCELPELKTRMKALWDQCRKEWKGQSALLSLSGEEAMEDIRAMAPAMAALLRLTEDFDLACQREKVRRNVVDFSDAEHYAIRGRAPALHNGVRSELLLTFDDERPQGYVAGVRSVYLDGETDTVAKGQTGLEPGDTLEFLCDYYSYDGSYEDSYLLGEPLTVGAEAPAISDVPLEGVTRAAYRITDLFGQHHWTPALSAQ